MPCPASPAAVATRCLADVVRLAPFLVLPVMLVVFTAAAGRTVAADARSAPEPVPAGRETASAPAANDAVGKAGGRVTGGGKAAAAGTAPERLDPAVVYRFDPIQTRLVAVRPAEIKTGHIYYRFNASRNRHVWSKAAGQGRFLYRLGPGSMQPARLFDVRATDEEKRKALESRAPLAAKLYATQGVQPALRLDESDRWSVAVVPSDGSVFDLETGRRFERHGDREVEVVHSGGNAWSRRGDRYVPAASMPVASGW